MKSSFSASRAIWVGMLAVNGPALLLLIGPLFAYHELVSHGVMEPSLRRAGALFIWGFVLAWLWWSVSVPKWRLWAYERVNDIPRLKEWAVMAGITWPEGFVLERTEIKSQEHAARERALDLQAARAAWSEGLLLVWLNITDVKHSGPGAFRITARGMHQGAAIGLELELVPPWKSARGKGAAPWLGAVICRSLGRESDALLGLFGAPLAKEPRTFTMRPEVHASAAVLGGNPANLKGVHFGMRLLFESPGGEARAGLYVSISLNGKLITIGELYEGYREPLLRLWSSAASPPLPAPGASAGELAAALAMAAHWNGYLREDAVRRLGELGDAAAIPMLLERANDWVPEVRHAARNALLSLLTPANAGAFAAHLPGLYHLQRCRRDDHNALIAAVNKFLAQPGNNTRLKAAINHPDPAVARIAARQCIEQGLLEPQELLDNCLSHRDVAVRYLACIHLRDLTGAIFQAFLQKALRDPFMPIRREAFLIRLRQQPDEGLRLAREFLFDRSAAVREIAVRRLQENGVDVPAILSAVLAEAAPGVLRLRCAVLGLAQLGAKPSLPAIEACTRHATPGVRKAALQALATLMGDAAKPFLLEGVRDASPAVAKEAARLIDKHCSSLDADELLDIAATAKSAHAMVACLLLAAKANKWDRLIVLMTLLRTAPPDNKRLADTLRDELRAWDTNFNRLPALPTPEQRGRIAGEYALGPGLYGEFLRFTLRASGIAV